MRIVRPFSQKHKGKQGESNRTMIRQPAVMLSEAACGAREGKATDNTSPYPVGGQGSRGVGFCLGVAPFEVLVCDDFSLRN